MVAKKLYDVNFDDWSNQCSPWNRCIHSGLWSARGSVYSRHTGRMSPKPSFMSGMVEHFPISTVCQNDASSQTFKLTGFGP